MVLGTLPSLHGRTVELNWTVQGVEAYDLRYETVIYMYPKTLVVSSHWRFVRVVHVQLLYYHDVRLHVPENLGLMPWKPYRSKVPRVG